MYHPAIELAKRYWVDDIPSAATSGTRLNNVLEALANGRPIPAWNTHFLCELGLLVLARLANGEIQQDQFDSLAYAERQNRVVAHERQMQAQEAEDRKREAEMWAQVEAERIKRESDPRFIARRRNRELRNKYGVDHFVEEHHFKRLMTILHCLETGFRLPEEDAIWLATEGREYASSEVLCAHNRLEADFFIEEYKCTNDVWKAVSASSHLRKCEAPMQAHELLAAIPDIRIKNAKLRSAIRTTHGGALRDLRRYTEAMSYAEEAHVLIPSDFRPCTLMGAICIETGQIEAGHEWYRKAEARGAKPHSIESELSSLLGRMPLQKREDTVGQLLRIDPVRYGWLRRQTTTKARRPTSPID